MSIPFRIRLLLGICLALFGFIYLFTATNKDRTSDPSVPIVFRIALSREPANLDPAHLSSSEGGYVLPQLYVTLFRLRAEKPQPLVAKSCTAVTSKKWVCQLRNDFKWSDGTSLTATDFARSFQRILNKQTTGTQAFHLLEDIAEINSPSPHELVFILKKPVGDLLYRLCSVTLAAVPVPQKIGALFSGAFTIDTWQPAERIQLKPNPYFPHSTLGQPPLIEYVFAADDITAMNLFQTGRIDLVRRVPTTLIRKLHISPHFVQVPMNRFDYIGFGARLKNHKDLRQALSLSLNYAELASLLSALGRPGCVGLTPSLYIDEIRLCFPPFTVNTRSFTLSKASQDLAPFTFAHSQQGGDDHTRMAQWVADQWQHNVNIRVNISAFENSYFLKRLRAGEFDIFRKGMNPSRNSCSAVLELFQSHRSENYIKYSNPDFDRLVTQLASLDPEAHAARSLCQRGLELLMVDYNLIPLGRIHFTLLVRDTFTGWTLSSLNELDLSDLRLR